MAQSPACSGLCKRRSYTIDIASIMYRERPALLYKKSLLHATNVNRAKSMSILDVLSTTICAAIRRLSPFPLSTFCCRDGAVTAHIALKNNGLLCFSDAAEISGGKDTKGHLGSMPVRNSSRHISCSACICGRAAAEILSGLVSRLPMGVGSDDNVSVEGVAMGIIIGLLETGDVALEVAGADIGSLLEPGISVPLVVLDAFDSSALRNSADALDDSPTLRKSVTRLSILPSSSAIFGGDLWDLGALRRRIGSDGSHCLLSR